MSDPLLNSTYPREKFMVRKIEMKPVNRRDILGFAGAAAFAAVATSLYPKAAHAAPADVDAAIKKLIGSTETMAGRITIELPQIAENGNTVPLGFEVESPMTDGDYVKSVHVFAEGNPLPDVASFHFTPASARAKISTRMRLAKTQNVVVVAQMSDGSVYMAKSEVKVTIGGCGG